MSDSDLQQSFARLRDADRRRTPPFAALAPRIARNASGLRWLRASLAASAAFAFLGGSFWLWRSPTPAPEPQTAALADQRRVEQLITAIDAHLDARVALTDWQSPTDFLLTHNSTIP